MTHLQITSIIIIIVLIIPLVRKKCTICSGFAVPEMKNYRKKQLNPQRFTCKVRYYKKIKGFGLDIFAKWILNLSKIHQISSNASFSPGCEDHFNFLLNNEDHCDGNVSDYFNVQCSPAQLPDNETEDKSRNVSTGCRGAKMS